MRLTVLFTIALQLVLTLGHAHAAEPLPAGMVEIPNGASFAAHAEPPRTPMTRRRSLYITGGVLTAVGVAFAAVGIGFLVSGSMGKDKPGCDRNCQLDNGINEGIGGVMLGFGAPHLLVGGIVMLVASGESH